MNIVPIYVSQIMCTNFLTVANRLLVILGRRVFSKSWSTFTLVRSNSVVTDVVWMACIWWLALIDICRFTNKGGKEKCWTFLRVFNESESLHLEIKVFFPKWRFAFMFYADPRQRTLHQYQGLHGLPYPKSQAKSETLYGYFRRNRRHEDRYWWNEDLRDWSDEATNSEFDGVDGGHESSAVLHSLEGIAEIRRHRERGVRKRNLDDMAYYYKGNPERQCH